jgi:hypothetical protein
MTTHTSVPADVDAESIIDLVHDCREVTGLLGSFVPAEIRVPSARGAMPIEITGLTAATLDGYEDYGS